MFNLSKFLKEEFLIEKDNLHGSIDSGGKTVGHVVKYVLPFLNKAGRKKTADSLSKYASRGKFDNLVQSDGENYNSEAESTHTLQLPHGDHEAGTKVRISHVVTGTGEEKKRLFAVTHSHGVIPLSKIAKPESLRTESKAASGIYAEGRVAKNLGGAQAGSSSTGIDFSYTGKGDSKPTIRGKEAIVESSSEKPRKMVKGVDRPDVRGESKLMKGKFGQSVLSWDKKTKKWSLTGRNSTVNDQFSKATITGRDGKKRNILDHLNQFHPNGRINQGISADAAPGTAREYLNSSNINTLHIHNLKKRKGGEVIVDRGTTFTVGDTSLARGKTRATKLGHLGNDDLLKLDGKVRILYTKTGKTEVTHYPPAGVMRDLADSSFNDPDNHRDLSNEEHAREFMQHVDEHIRKFKNKKGGKRKLNEMLLEAKANKAAAAFERMQSSIAVAQKNKQIQQSKENADSASKNQSYNRKSRDANIAARAVQKHSKEGQTQTFWRDEDGIPHVGGGEFAVNMAKAVNLSDRSPNLSEEAPANAMGTAGISGAQTAVDAGIAGYDLPIGMVRRKPPKMFAGKAVFTVPSSDFYNATLGRKKGKHYRSYVKGELGEEVRQYALENKNAPIILEDETTGAMMYLKYGKEK